jgi:RNA polymerase sigma factor (sigma-70 family)
MSPSPGVGPTCQHHFSREDEARICDENLAWAENLLRKHYGLRAVEWAGEGLLAACRSFDPDLGHSFRGFAATVIRRTAARGLKAMYGAPGSAKHEAQANSVTYEDYDQQAVRHPSGHCPTYTQIVAELSNEDSDEYTAILEFFDCQPAQRRLIGLGAMLTGMTARQLSEVLRVDRRTITSTLADLRRLVSAA